MISSDVNKRPASPQVVSCLQPHAPQGRFVLMGSDALYRLGTDYQVVQLGEGCVIGPGPDMSIMPSW